MNEKFESYLKDLSPELQEKARQCKTKEDLNVFLADNDLELPEEALKMVAGGCTTSHCEHNFIEIERIDMVPTFGSNGPVGHAIHYNGMQVQNIKTNQCSKCSELHYYVLTFPNADKYVNQNSIISYKEISAAEYNSLKAQKTW
ncbi:MAG: hypothetical protein J6O40_05905 [Ruminococcus sp.]|nr:hypothetical protein [Ruminococcus sp.]